MKIKKTKYGRIILNLVEELYKNEVIDTQMKELIIGEGKDFASKEDWIDYRINTILGD
ncbi:hypothetical protein LCGC14_1301390 [marine sediment metagenome]|uniref:Uncharacterized protein n=1 Tax=marine sediment metagenome TaxID=412755 RepID=A0A0F9LA46_9ZZZZ